MKYGAIAASILALAGCAGLPRETPPAPAPAPALSVFVVAHPDDWQLFMNPAAFHAMNEPHEKAVFVHVSAGDAGRGVGGEPTPYYLAREEGALRAIRFMANAVDATAALGDGNIVNGNDFKEHPLSLQRLRSGASAETKAVDDSARYAGWSDFVATLEAVIVSELAPGTALNFHIAELNERRNPGEHPDHRAVAFAMEEVAAR
ncbi:MAG TPA: PIG-L family deacetylase [Steroidobacteraceae bacterium]|nr:PIG-L family deacetylase [Steroidobacteraceae bacterium]